MGDVKRGVCKHCRFDGPDRGADYLDGPLRCPICGSFDYTLAAPPASPFPQELVERVKRLAKLRSPEISDVGIHETVDETLSVVAEWLRSDEVRERVAKTLHASYEREYACQPWDGMHPVGREGFFAEADAVLAAVLEGAN